MTDAETSTAPPGGDVPLPPEPEDELLSLPGQPTEPDDTIVTMTADMAESALLGAMCNDSTALVEGLAKLEAGFFALPEHRVVFEALADIVHSADAYDVDVVILASALRKQNLLEAAGGVNKLADIVQSSYANPRNVAQYARIVVEEHLRRELTRLFAEAQAEGRSTPDVTAVINDAQARLNDLSDSLNLDSATVTADQAVNDALARIREIQEQGTGLLGVTTGLRDLDNLVRGMQDGKFYIVAARPSVGKSLLALHLAKSAAAAGTPILFASFEMGPKELMTRLIVSEAEVASDNVKSGDLSPQELDLLDAAGDRLRTLPLTIEDNQEDRSLNGLNATVNRLANTEEGLGMVVIDYIQLIEHSVGYSSANRQEIVSAISRNLKLMSRRFNIPIVGLSQLSRALENRPNKRPVLADLRECLTGDTLIWRSDTGTRVPIAELADNGPIPVWSVNDDGKVVEAVMSEVWSTGTKPVFEVKFSSGRVVRATGNHPFLGFGAWVKVADLAPGDRIATVRSLPAPTDTSEPFDGDTAELLGYLIGDGSHLTRAALHVTSSEKEVANHIAALGLAAFPTLTPHVVQERTWFRTFLRQGGLTHGTRNPCGAWLDSLGLHDERSHEKFVPAAAFALPEASLWRLLAGLWATDGSFPVASKRNGAGNRKVYANYTTSSRQLAEDIASLLLRVGVLSRIVTAEKGDHTSYMVTVNGADNVRRLASNLTLVGDREQRRLLALDELDGVSTNTNVGSLPKEAWDNVRADMAEHDVTARALAEGLEMSYCGSALYKRDISRDRMNRAADAVPSPELRGLTDNDLFWDKVVSVEPVGDAEVFDATVPGPNSFLANDIVSHNSGALEQDADVVMGLYRDDMYEPDSPRRGEMEVIVLKQRDGPTGTARVACVLSTSTLGDLPLGAASDPSRNAPPPGEGDTPF